MEGAAEEEEGGEVAETEVGEERLDVSWLTLANACWMRSWAVRSWHTTSADDAMDGDDDDDMSE